MTKLCPRGKAAAKRKFKVYPSAYANAYASKICAGKIKDPSGTKRKDFKGPKPMQTGGMLNQRRNRLNAPGERPIMGAKTEQGEKARREYIEQLKQVNDEKKRREKTRPKKGKGQQRRPRIPQFELGRPAGAKKGAIMVILAKKPVSSPMKKKKTGGMTAGSQSGLGRIQKSIQAEILREKKGGGYDAGTPGKLRDYGTRINLDGVTYKPGKAPAVTPDRRKRLKELMERRARSRALKQIGKTVGILAGPAAGVSAGKALADRIKNRKAKQSPGPSPTRKGGKGPRGLGKGVGKGFKKIPVMEVKSGGDAKIKKVIKGLNKASKLHAGQAKSLGTLVNKKSVGGMADYYKDLM